MLSRRYSYPTKTLSQEGEEDDDQDFPRHTRQFLGSALIAPSTLLS
jgi:hypothetical protein